MGVDARMFVRTRAKVTPEEVRRWAYELSASFGTRMFRIETDEGLHALEIVKTWEQDGPMIVPKAGETFIEARVWTRFYGTGYPRGDLPFLIAVAQWLERRIPRARVWYGGDSSGELARPFDRRARDKLFDYFVEEGRGWLASVSRLTRDLAQVDEIPPPMCGFCAFPMVEYGFGPDYASFACPGCGGGVETLDNGKTFRPLPPCPVCETSLDAEDRDDERTLYNCGECDRFLESRNGGSTVREVLPGSIGRRVR